MKFMRPRLTSKEISKISEALSFYVAYHPTDALALLLLERFMKMQVGMYIRPRSRK